MQNPINYYDPDGKLALAEAAVVAAVIATVAAVETARWLIEHPVTIPEFPSWNDKRIETELQGIVDKAKSNTESISVPIPPKKSGKYTCIARIQDLNRSNGSCPVFGWGWGVSKDFQTAKNMAVQMANLTVGAVDTHHAQWRCVDPKGDILRPQ